MKNELGKYLSIAGEMATGAVGAILQRTGMMPTVESQQKGPTQQGPEI